jgi:shikimate dehydrogenase
MVPEMTLDTSKFKNKKLSNVGVIGMPISHSKSPIIHNYFIQKLDISADYKPIEIKSMSQLSKFMTRLKSPHWIGVNVTIPYKEVVIPYLDAMHDDVKIIGACNTIVNNNGQLMGYNTDAEGFYYPIQTFSLNCALIMGNGGASKAVLYQCAKRGIKTIVLVARNHNKSNEFCNRIMAEFNVSIAKETFDSITAYHIKSADIIVNTTSVGMNSTDAVFDILNYVSSSQIYYDLIYNPWETSMLKSCKAQGLTVFNGAPMLAHQAALAFNYFFNQSADTKKMLEILEKNSNG